jgi:hypothetical protein
MSHDLDSAHQDAEIPVSAGTPLYVQMLVLLALLIVFMQGAFVVISSTFGRIWPAADSVKIPL